MADREKLIRLLDEVHHKHLGKDYMERLGTIADYLIKNGVTIIEKPKPQKMLCIQWNPGHHGLMQRCEWMGKHKVCSCNGDYEKCDYSQKG